MKKKSQIILIVWVLAALGFSTRSSAQSAAQDSTNHDQGMSAVVDSVDGEMVLDIIEIKGKIDKPGVIIMPKRVEPEIGEIALERSFNKEVKEGVGEIPKPEKELRQLDRIESIKKTVERKRK